MAHEQATLPLGPIRNSHLFSNHWLEHRLPCEPEWDELRAEAERVLDRLAELWRAQRDMVAQYGDEQGLEEAFIQPVLQTLGWHLKYQTFLRGRKPDYALFLDDTSRRQAVKAGRTSQDFWKYPIVLADAKAWDHSLDRPVMVKRRRKYQREYPPEQIESYLQHSQLDYAILTNGRFWRLIPRTLTPEQPRFETYLECDISTILDYWVGTGPGADGKGLLDRPHVLDDFGRFYLFFSPVAFRRTAERTALVERAAKGSSEYRLGVGEGLKEQVFEALRISIEGFLTFSRNNLDPERDLAHCHDESFILLYRLLFIMYAEVYLVTDKGERRSTGSYYTPNHIVDYIVEKTLGPLCRRIDAKLESDIAKAKDACDRARGPRRDELAWNLKVLRTSFDDRVLALRVLDPAMGSGHFLLSACRYLAEEIATNPHTGDPEADRLRPRCGPAARGRLPPGTCGAWRTGNQGDPGGGVGREGPGGRPPPGRCRLPLGIGVPGGVL